MTFLLALACAGCDHPPGDAPEYRADLFAFGTLINITLYGVDSRQAQQAIQAIDAMYQQQHHEWHAWQQGELNSLNQAIAAGTPRETDSSILQLIRMGQAFERKSGGLFNPGIGKLLQLWSFQQDEPGQIPPSDAAVSAWLDSAPGSLDLTIEGNTVSSRNPDVKLDLGGFAKGYSVGLAVDLLEKRGIRNLIVNAGGDLCMRGSHGPRPWRIGIRDPDSSGVMASIELSGAHCVFTSGDYERYFVYQGERYHHILDPRTGYPARDSRSVTVLADNAALADAAATALFVAGPEDWQAVAAAMGIQDVLMLDNSGTAQVTPALAEQLHFDKMPKHLELAQPISP